MTGSSILLAALTLATTPDRVLVVVNEDSPLSVRIGAMYAEKRSIPTRQVCRLRTTTSEITTRARYDKEIEQPITAHLRREKLDAIHYIVLTQGIPLRVLPETQGDWQMTDSAAVDSELALLYARQRGLRPNLRGTIPNPFFRQRDAPFDQKAFPIFLVTRLAAYDYATVERMVAKSIAARDPNQNRWGKVVLDLRSGDDEEGNDWLRTASLILPPERVVTDQTRMVITNVKDALGYASWGSNDKNRSLRRLGFHWLPGALATEFVSTNGRTLEKPPDSWNIGTWGNPKTWFKNSPQSLAADMLDEGATGVSAHVDEPYLSQCARPDILFPAYVLQGRNLAEAFWMSIPSLSWMNIVIGDPLCRLAPPPANRPPIPTAKPRPAPY